MLPAPNALRHSIVRGAAVWTALGAAVPVVLVGAAIVHHETANILLAALALLACFAAGGALGGLVHGATLSLRERDHAAMSWGAVACVAVVTTMLAVRIVAQDATGPLLEGDRIVLLTGGAALGKLAVAGALSGVLWARTIRRNSRTPLMTGLSDDVGNGFLLLWIAVGALTSFGFLFDSQRVDIPETPQQARTVLASAERAAHDRPRDTQSQLALAVSLMRLDRMAEAMPVFQRVVELDPKNAYAHDVIGWTLNHQGKFADAVPHLEEALRTDPRYVDALHNLGWANLGLKHYQAAEVALREAARLDPHSPSIASDYAKALYGRGNRNLAVQYMLRASRLAPNEPYYHGMAGDLLRDLQRFDEATAQFREVIRIDPQFQGAWADLGIVRYVAGDAVGAATALHEARRLNPRIFDQHQMERAMLRDAEQGHTGAVHLRRSPAPASPDSSRAAAR